MEMSIKAIFRRSNLASIIVFLSWLGSPLIAHEFWIAPLDYAIEKSGMVEAHFRVGQNMKGRPQPYLPRDIVSFDAEVNGEPVRLNPIIGDRPALSFAADAEGLMIAAVETRKSVVTYKTLAKFRKFSTSKGWPDLGDQHANLGFPDTGFREHFSRFAKTLVRVGNGFGQDRALGLFVELVALDNPYTVGGKDIRVQYLRQGAPIARALVTVFSGPPGEPATSKQFLANAEGIVTITTKPSHVYLVDAVHIQPAENLDGVTAVVWESFWASLTFQAQPN
jgi:uncharacterized GH25 family protein